MNDTQSLQLFGPPAGIPERREAPREPEDSTCWMIDHAGATMLRCQCLDSTDRGMRLRVPLGYGVAEGQRYELQSHRPGEGAFADFGMSGRRWATVVRTQILLGDDHDHLDVGVVLDDAEGSFRFAAAHAGELMFGVPS